MLHASGHLLLRLGVIVLALWYVLLLPPLSAQERSVDSLRAVLTSAPEDSLRVKTLLALASQLNFRDALSAMRYAEQALELARRLRYERGIALSQNAFGVAARIQGLYAVAASYHFDALKKSEALADTQGIARALHNIGRVYEVQRENDKALEYLRKALDLWKQHGGASEIAETKHYMGNCFGNKRLFDSAMMYYSTALSLRRTLNERRGIATLTNNIGWILRLQGHYDSALAMFRSAFALYDSLADLRGKALALDNTGIVYFNQKKYAASVKTLTQALNFAERSGDRREINDLYAALANSHEASNDFREANTYRRLRDALKDSLFNERSAKLVAELNSRYESEKREQELLMLQKDADKNELLRNASIAVTTLALGFLVYFAVSFRQSRHLNSALRQKQTELEAEKVNADTLLLNIMPASIAERLKAGELNFAQRYTNATVFFADIANFTPLAASMLPEELVQILSEVFIMFDTVLEKHGLEKIKTIGDCYMVASGLPQKRDDHAHAAARAALEMVAELVRFNEMYRTNLELRVGMHTGAVVAGVIGKKKFAFDLWGDTVNIASRMESHGEAGRIHCTEEIYQLLQNDCVFEERGMIELKGRGMMNTYFLVAKPGGVMPPAERGYNFTI
ncbi:MAG: tetratricopeptide repeat protein [Candidatus Kapabacteria bacterium]|nr:tetratricopeptide repeat protein [Candidatus Kapabacteria bacterium]